MPSLQKVSRRAAALLLVALVIFVLTFGAILPIVDGLFARAELIAQQKQQLAEYAGIVAQAAALRKRQQSLDAETQTAEFLEARSELEAQTEIQAKISELAKESDVRIRATRKLAPKERGEFLLHGLGMDLHAGIASVQKFLYAVEAARPYLFIEAATISALGGANAPSNRETVLEVRLDVYAAAFEGAPQ